MFRFTVTRAFWTRGTVTTFRVTVNISCQNEMLTCKLSQENPCRIHLCFCWCRYLCWSQSSDKTFPGSLINIIMFSSVLFLNDFTLHMPVIGKKYFLNLKPKKFWTLKRLNITSSLSNINTFTLFFTLHSVFTSLWFLNIKNKLSTTLWGYQSSSPYSLQKSSSFESEN